MKSDLQETLRFVQNQNMLLREENGALQQEVKSLREILDCLLTLQEMSLTLTERTDALQLLDRILQVALESIGAADGSLILLDEETQDLVFVVAYGEIRDSLIGHRLPPGVGIAGWVADHGEPVRVADVTKDPRFSPNVDESFDFQTRSMLCVPLICGNRVAGVIQALNKKGDEEFIEGELLLLSIVARLAAAAIHRAETAVTHTTTV